jgi:hypothetical protein
MAKGKWATLLFGMALLSASCHRRSVAPNRPPAGSGPGSSAPGGPRASSGAAGGEWVDREVPGQPEPAAPGVPRRAAARPAIDRASADVPSINATTHGRMPLWRVRAKTY